MPEEYSRLRGVEPADVTRFAERLDLDLTESEVEDFADLINDKRGVLDLLEGMAQDSSQRVYPVRDPGGRPLREDDPLNAFVTRCQVPGADSGPLAGVSVGVKDNIPVAAVELTLGTRVMEGYVPKSDPTVVTRLLDAGATIQGKTNLDELAISGSGELGFGGPIRNPVDSDYLAGGSSGGSAIAVIEETVDLALGTDQAGSIRTPAAWCGCVGHKPTYGVVPYTGCIPGGPTYDHVGPMANSARMCARAMDVLAGPDGTDPRQPTTTIDNCLDAIGTPPDEFAIGVLEEGFGHEDSEPAVDAAARESLDRLADVGASVESISVPDHGDGILIWLGVGWAENAALLRDDGQVYYRETPHNRQFIQAFANARRARSHEFAPTVKLKLLMGAYLREVHHGRHHAIAQELRASLRAAYDEALQDIDLLALPTTPTTAFPIEEDLSLKETVRRAQGKAGRTVNTMPFNMTGHPAASVPCGTDEDGLPIGLMLVGARGDDATVLAGAHAVEQLD